MHHHCNQHEHQAPLGHLAPSSCDPNHSPPSSAAFPTFCPLSYAYEWCRVLGARGAAPSHPCASPPGPLVFPVGAPGIVYLLLLPTVAHGHICHTSPGALTHAPTCLHAHMDADRHTQLHTHRPVCTWCLSVNMSGHVCIQADSALPTRLSCYLASLLGGGPLCSPPACPPPRTDKDENGGASF